MTKNVNPALPVLFAELKNKLQDMLKRVEQSEGYLSTHGQNSGIGGIAGLDCEIEDIAALYRATLAVHRGRYSASA